MQTLIKPNLENQYLPDVVSAPGETLQEVLIDRQMTQTELAGRLGLAHKTVNEIIHGKASLTHETAIALERVLGIPASFWDNYEMAYRTSIARNEAEQRLLEAKDWLNSIPWKKALEKGWLRQQASTSEWMSEILHFFGVASPTEYEKVYSALTIQWKRSSKSPIDPHAVAFWLRQGELEAARLSQQEGIEWGEYNSQLFEKCLKQARGLTLVEGSSSFVRELQTVCAASGVAVVLVPELEGVRACGATRWLSPSRALIQLSLRYKTNDHFWFTFFHEAAHVLKHSKRQMFVEYFDKHEPDIQENEANEFAQNLLIPPSDYARLAKLGSDITENAILTFAREIGVAPGIVVGRLQKENETLPNKFYYLKEKYEWEPPSKK